MKLLSLRYFIPGRLSISQSSFLLEFLLRYKEIKGRDKQTNEEVVKYYPYLPAIFEWRGKRSRPIEGLLDSGSDGVVMPLEMAQYLGLDLVPDKKPMNVVGARIPCFTSKVDIIIGRAGRYCSTIDDVVVKIPQVGDTPILFGRNPVFELFTITFFEKDKKFLIKPC